MCAGFPLRARVRSRDLGLGGSRPCRASPGGREHCASPRDRRRSRRRAARAPRAAARTTWCAPPPAWHCVPQHDGRRSSGLAATLQRGGGRLARRAAPLRAGGGGACAALGARGRPRHGRAVCGRRSRGARARRWPPPSPRSRRERPSALAASMPALALRAGGGACGRAGLRAGGLTACGRRSRGARGCANSRPGPSCARPDPAGVSGGPPRALRTLGPSALLVLEPL